MSTRCRQSARPHRDQDGNVLCSCGCGRKPVPPRRTWYSEECVNSWKIRNDPAYVREQVYDRDKGVCESCGRDTEKLRRQYRRLWMATKGLSFRLIRNPSGTMHCKIRHLSRWRERGRWPDMSRSWWEADHIVEVVRGGGQCGLDNYQTLCVPCHKDKTARLARERAQQRKAAQDPNLQLFPDE